MATLEQLEAALVKADAAGNADDARALAQAVRAARGAAPKAAPEPSFGQQVMRQQGLGVRNLVTGLADVAGIVYNPVALTMNKLSGDRVPYTSASDATGGFLDQIGLPRPANETEQFHSDINRALSGNLATVGAAGAVARAPGLIGAAGRLFSAQPGLQAMSTGSGATASGLARENGATPGQQTLIGLAAGLAPGAVQYGAQATGRGLIRGGETGRATVEANQATFGRAGTNPSVGQATENRRTRGLESLLSGAPGGSGPMTRAAETQAQELGQRAESLASILSPRASAEQAGRAIETGISGPGGFKESTRGTQAGLYDDLDALIDPQARVGVTNAKATLPQINPVIPGAPNLTPMFQNSRIQGIERALKGDTEGLDAVATRPGVSEQIAATKKNLAGLAQGIEAQNAKDATEVAQKNVLRQAVGLKPIQHTPYPVMGDADIDSQIQKMLASKVDGKLPYEALKKLRTAVGQEIENAGLMSDVPRSKWRALYGALAQDMRGAAEAAGPRAMQAWSRANNYSRAMMDRMETISHVLDKNGGPEKVFSAAISGTSEGATTLRAVTRSLPPDAQKQLAAAVVKRMGRATAGKQDELGEMFSTETFLTNWNKMAPEAKSALFARQGPQFNANLEAIAKVAANVRAGSKVFANPSGSGNKVAQYGAATSFGVAMVTGHPGGAAAVAAGALSANAMARLMTNPNFVGWLARQTKLPAGAFASQVHVLASIAQHTHDPDLLAAAKSYSQQGGQ